jgi:hypothetical protein
MLSSSYYGYATADGPRQKEKRKERRKRKREEERYRGVRARTGTCARVYTAKPLAEVLLPAHASRCTHRIELSVQSRAAESDLEKMVRV